MKKVFLAATVVALMSSAANAEVFPSDFMSEGYNSIGLERFDFKTSASRDGSLGTTTMISFNRGYRLNRFLFLEGGLALPVGNKVLNEYENTFCTYDPVNGCAPNTLTSVTYENQIKPSVAVDIGFRFDVPVHRNLTVFASLGYSYTRLTHSGYYATDSVTGEKYYNLVDVLPAPEQVESASRTCLVTGGNESQLGCDPVTAFDNKYGAKGAAFGAGATFNFSPNASFVVEYKNYSHDSGALEPEGISITYQWRF